MFLKNLQRRMRPQILKYYFARPADLKKKAVPWEGVIFPSKVKAALGTKGVHLLTASNFPRMKFTERALSRDLAASTTVGSPGDETS